MKEHLDALYKQYAIGSFIDTDPIQIPYLFSKKQDVEIAGFFSAIFSWGQRATIIKKAKELMNRMDNSPYEFIQNYCEKSRKNVEGFKHRTFNVSDFDFYARALKEHYRFNNSLALAFQGKDNAINIESHLVYFYDYIRSLVPYENRNLKHISTPSKKSACKRLCMYLRWMVRKDAVDMGLWTTIRPSQLVIPLDVHVWKIAQSMDWVGIHTKPSWDTAVEITNILKTLDSDDPVKYDLALFSLGMTH